MRRKGNLAWAGWFTLACLLLLAVLAQPAQAINQHRTDLSIPTDRLVWKIALNQDGIYRLSYAELQAAGVPVETANPAQIEMMWRGQAVAYQFDGDADALFEPGEALLFYGWRFDSSRDEMQYVKNNVFWLWLDGTRTEIPTLSNIPSYPEVHSVSAEITVEPENTFSLTNTRHWDSFPNDFDAWYWTQIGKTSTQPASFDLNVELPHPAPNSTSASYLIEVTNRDKTSHLVSTALNAYTATSHTWSGLVNTNLTQTVPHNLLHNGTNTVTVGIQSQGTDRLLVNRITVEYERLLIADNQFLQFEAAAGAQAFVIGGFSAEDGLTVWEISDRTAPTAITTHGSYDSFIDRHRVGGYFVEESAFIATAPAQFKSVDAIDQYRAPRLSPGDGADWVAIAHSSLITDTQRLADHRSTHSRLATHVVNVEDIINLYGYGLPLPSAMRDYLLYAHENWAIPPAYVTLVGSATHNPRQLACQAVCFSGWTDSEPTLVPTYLLPKDRFLGLMVTDHFFGTLVGDDDRQDISVGRLPAESAAQLAIMVDKIIQYEANLVSAETWLQNLLFISDNVDGAGNFCTYNNAHISEYQGNFNTNHLCLDEIDKEALRDGMFSAINDGVLMANYLGHGFVDKWAHESILTQQDSALFTNNGKPFVQISGNCLDGHFGWVGSPSISETMLSLEDSGSAAHWGSTGLGYLIEHQLMHLNFTEALQEHGITRIGDAIRYGKNAYLDLGYYAGQAYSSVLLGDPAMQIVHPELTVENSSPTRSGDQFTFVASVTNSGALPASVTLTQTLSANLGIDALAQSANVEQIVQLPNNVVVIETGKLQMGASSSVTVTATLTDGREALVSAAATATSGLFEVDLSDNSAESSAVSSTTTPTAATLHIALVKHSGPSAIYFAFTYLTFITALLRPGIRKSWD